MSLRPHLAPLVAIAAALGAGTCVVPTERDSSVHVSITPIHVLSRGRDTVASATAWQLLDPRDSQPIPNVKFVWLSSNPLIATVDNAGRIVGVQSGTVIITAAAANFDKGATAAKDTVRVAGALEIDSLRPKTIKYGQELSIYGVGVDSILLAKLGNADLIAVPFADTVFPNGTARTRYWVPPPAHTDSLFFLGIFNGNGVFGFLHADTTKVIERDLYDPNATSPARISLNGPGPFPNTPLSVLSFFNPALAFEHLPIGVTAGADWFRLGKSPSLGDVTIILESPELAGTFSTFLSDSLGWNGTTKTYSIGANSWTFGPGSHACHGLGFSPAEAVADSTIVAFKGLAVDSLDAIAVYTKFGRYGLEVINTYQSELPADTHEDDNSCNAADAFVPRILPFRDTLAIENPHDIDWIRFTVPPSPPLPTTNVELRVHANAGVNPDSVKALDLYVIKKPNRPSETVLAVALQDTAVVNRLDRDTTVALAAGDYYAVVLDVAGATTYYEICAQVAPLVPIPAECPTSSAWPAPPARSGTAAGAPALRVSPTIRRGRSPRVSPLLNLGRQR